MSLAEDIVRLEQGLRELMIKYEQYFLGIEKREPLQLLDEVERHAKRYQSTAISNTMLRFKYQTLITSFHVHKQKWSRITRLIEEGKYHRNRPRESAPPPAPLLPPAPEDAELERVYRQYLAARRACNLPTDNVSRERIADAIERQKPLIARKYGCDAIEFSVVVENGSPRIKARPKS